MIHPYRSVVPSVHPSVRVADSAHVIGARLHGCTVASHCRIGIGAIVDAHLTRRPADDVAAARKG